MGIPWQGEAAVQSSSHRLYESMGNVQYLAYAIALNMLLSHNVPVVSLIDVLSHAFGM